MLRYDIIVRNIPVSEGREEVDAAMDPVVHYNPPIYTVLLRHVLVYPSLYLVQNRLPTVTRVLAGTGNRHTKGSSTRGLGRVCSV